MNKQNFNELKGKSALDAFMTDYVQVYYYYSTYNLDDVNLLTDYLAHTYKTTVKIHVTPTYANERRRNYLVALEKQVIHEYNIGRFF